MFGRPNITGEFGTYRADKDGRYRYADGAFGTKGHGFGYSGQNELEGFAWTFEATKSSGLYGRSKTVQPNSFFVLPCIKF